MPAMRSYRDSCGIARALDVVGERWCHPQTLGVRPAAARITPQGMVAGS